MKAPALLATFCVFVIQGFAFAQSPSKVETEKWLSKILTSNIAEARSPDDLKFLWIIKSITFQQDTVKVTGSYASWFSGSGGYEPQEFTRIFDLHNLFSNASIELLPNLNPPIYAMSFRSKNENTSFSIFFMNKELAERVAKAFSHLIKLSGGKDEPF